jgi:hypothetical protein
MVTNGHSWCQPCADLYGEIRRKRMLKDGPRATFGGVREEVRRIRCPSMLNYIDQEGP